MKVLIAADIFPPQAGGPATYAVLLANSLLNKGHSVQMASLNPDSDESVVSCVVRTVSSKNKLVRYTQYLKILWQQSKDVDVVYAMGPVNAGLPAVIVSTLRKKKCVVKVVGDYAWEQGMQRAEVTEDIDVFQADKGSGMLVISVFRAIERFVVRKANAVVTPSKYLQRMVIGWGAKSENVMVVYNSVEVAEIVEKQKPEGEQWIVTGGRLVKWKGYDVIMNAFSKIAGNNMKLIILGSGPEHARLAQRAQGRDDILCTGLLSREETYQYIKAADVFVLNSAYEGLSHILIESMKLGTYILASDKGGNPELLEGRNVGEVFPYNDEVALTEMLQSVLANKKVPSITNSELQIFSVEEMIANTEAVLKSVCTC